MTVATKPPNRRRLTVLAAAAALTVAAPLAAGSPALADANFPSPNGNTSTASIVTYDDLVAELLRIEKTARFGVDAFTLAEAGTAVTA